MVFTPDDGGWRSKSQAGKDVFLCIFMCMCWVYKQEVQTHGTEFTALR